MISNIFNSRDGSPAPDINVNSRAFDQLSIVKRLYGQAQASAKDLHNLSQRVIPEYTFPNGTSSSSMSQNQSEMMKFKSQLSAMGGLAKPNWFKVIISTPMQSGTEREVSLFCESAVLPSHNILTSPLVTYGPAVQYAYGKEYEAIPMTFLVDTNFKIKSFFDNWMNLIYDDSPSPTNDVGFLNDYGVTITIFQLSAETAGDVYMVNLLRAYPKTIGSLSLDHSQRDQFHKLQVSFVYEKMFSSSFDISSPTLDSRYTSKLGDEIIRGLPNGGSVYTENNPFGTSFESLKAGAASVASSIFGTVDKYTAVANNSMSNLFRNT
jgi:hypothetical protein